MEILNASHVAIWNSAKHHLDVRDNDVHTLHSYQLVKLLLQWYPEAAEEVCLLAMMLHDTGWSKIPVDKILKAFGPNNQYPELTRAHELHGVEIASALLKQHGYSREFIAQATAIIDGHDTTADARSLEDSIVKDADKLWRYTPHGITTIGKWFDIGKAEVLEILDGHVLPKLLTAQGKWLAKSLLEIAYTEMNAGKLIKQ
ncbi:MAG: HD domain-containing protein [Flavobacteriales bacterium]|nr:HD domain-containing protein [Flavobacteriales bacterium]